MAASLSNTWPLISLCKCKEILFDGQLCVLKISRSELNCCLIVTICAEQVRVIFTSCSDATYYIL